MEKNLMRLGLRLAADGMLHTVPMEAKRVYRRSQEIIPPCGQMDMPAGDRHIRKFTYAHREMFSDSSYADADVCLTCDAPDCAGLQSCFEQRRRLLRGKDGIR